MDPAVIDEALTISQLLQRNSEELSSLLAALGGEYVLPEAGGDLLRDGPGVLPTGGEGGWGREEEGSGVKAQL